MVMDAEEGNEKIARAIWPLGKWLAEIQQYAPAILTEYTCYEDRLRVMDS